MPKKKSKTRQPLYKERIKKLNALGITNYNETRKQSRKVQGKIKRLWNQYGEIANNPEHYTKRKVNKERQKILKNLDYPVHQDTVYIYSKGYKKVSLKYETVNGKKRTVLRRTTKDGDKEYKALIVERGEILDELEKFEKKRLPAGEFLTVQIGNRSQFSSRFKSMKQLQWYLDNKFSPQQPLKKKDHRGKRAQEKLKQELISQMTIVKFKR